jgi:AcrR family transcriptional regulator
MAAAERVFAERGFAATPLRDLIAACNCSTTAFYARFGSKDAVLAAIVRRLFEDLHGAAADALPRARSIHEGCEVGIEILGHKLRGNKGLWRVVLTEAAHTPGTRTLVRDVYAALAKLLAMQIASASARGRMSCSDPASLAWAVVGALSLHMMRWCVFGELTNAELLSALRSSAQTLLLTVATPGAAVS